MDIITWGLHITFGCFSYTAHLFKLPPPSVFLISIETQYLVHHVHTFLRFTVTLLTPMHYITDRVLPYLAEAGFVSATLSQYSSRTWETVGLAGSWES